MKGSEGLIAMEENGSLVVKGRCRKISYLSYAEEVFRGGLTQGNARLGLLGWSANRGGI